MIENRPWPVAESFTVRQPGAGAIQSITRHPWFIREVKQCRPGQVKEMPGTFKGVSELMVSLGMPGFRFCTDLSGPSFWPLVAEIQAESGDAFLDMEGRIMSSEDAGKLMAGYHELVLNGRRDIHRVES